MTKHAYHECDRDDCGQRVQDDGLMSMSSKMFWPVNWYARNDPDGRSLIFCSVMCAGRWEKDNPPDLDEVRGQAFRIGREAL